MMNTLIIYIVIMILLIYMSTFIKLCTLNMYRLLPVNYTLIKIKPLVKKWNNLLEGEPLIVLASPAM